MGFLHAVPDSGPSGTMSTSLASIHSSPDLLLHHMALCLCLFNRERPITQNPRIPESAIVCSAQQKGIGLFMRITWGHGDIMGRHFDHLVSNVVQLEIPQSINA